MQAIQCRLLKLSEVKEQILIQKCRKWCAAAQEKDLEGDTGQIVAFYGESVNIMNLSHCDYKQDQKKKLTCGVPCSWHFWKRIEVIKLPESTVFELHLEHGWQETEFKVNAIVSPSTWLIYVCITNDWNKGPPKEIQRKDWTETGCLITSIQLTCTTLLCTTVPMVPAQSLGPSPLKRPALPSIPMMCFAETHCK